MTCFVYFLRPIGMDGPIKIGSSYSPEQRLHVVEAWSPWPLELIVAIPGDANLERKIQNCFADCHSHGEWFHSTPRLRGALADLIAGLPVEDAIDLTKPMGSVLGNIQRATMLRNGTKPRSVPGEDNMVSHAQVLP